MKNIHILPTDKPSRLFKAGIEFIFDISEVKYTERYKELHNYINHTIYITSDEEIKERDWFIEPINKSVLKLKDNADKLINSIFPTCKKIILTTDQDLIKDGVKAIDDEFLEWFVNNPSCEEVEVEINSYMDKNISDSITFTDYKIIIPKEEPKQETLEETLTAEEFFINKIKENIEWEGEITLWKVPLNAELSMRWTKEYSDYVIKWQQQQMYSEEEVLQIIKNAFNQGERYGWDTQFSIGNIDEMKSKIPFISLEKYLETFNK